MGTGPPKAEPRRGGHAAGPHRSLSERAGDEAMPAAARSPTRRGRGPSKKGQKGIARTHHRPPARPPPRTRPTLTSATPEQESDGRRARAFIGAAGPAPGPPTLRREGGRAHGAMLGGAARAAGGSSRLSCPPLSCPPLPFPVEGLPLLREAMA